MRSGAFVRRVEVVLFAEVCGRKVKGGVEGGYGAIIAEAWLARARIVGGTLAGDG